MPYNNQYNVGVAGQVRGFSQKHINRENAINDFSTSYEIPSKVESAVLREPEVHGGSGFAAATAHDLGFEPTLGATSADGKPRRPRTNKIAVGEGLSAAGVSAGGSWSKGQNMFYEVLKGFAGGAKKTRKPKATINVVAEAPSTEAPATVEGGKRTRKKKGAGVSGGALLSLKDLDKMHGQPEPTVQAKVTVKAEGGRAVGSGVSGGARGKRNAIVKEVMKKHGLSLPAASKYVKEHKLY
jgi:hypothetical protein